MKKLALLFSFIGVLALLQSCGDLFNMGMDDPVRDTRPTYVVKSHVPLRLGFYMSAPYDSAATIDVCFSSLLDVTTKVVDSETYYASDFEYTFVSDGTRQKVKSGAYAYPKVHDDGHVYFSLFESTGAEKSYDVDLGGTIHSWTRRGDSVDVVIPEGFLMSAEKKGEPFWLSFIGDTLTNRTAALSFDGTWNSFYYLEAGKSKQSSYETDSIHISSIIHWCSNPNPMYAYYCQD